MSLTKSIHGGYMSYKGRDTMEALFDTTTDPEPGDSEMRERIFFELLLDIRDSLMTIEFEVHNLNDSLVR